MLSPDAAPVSTFPLPLSAYPPPSPDGLLATLGDRMHARAVQPHRDRHFRARRSCTRFSPRGSPRSPIRPGAARRAPAGTSAAAGAEPPRRGAALPRRGRGRVRALGGGRWWPRCCRTSAGTPRRTTSTQASTTPSRCSSSSSWRWPRRGRSCCWPKRRMRRVAALGGSTPAAWWLTILMIGPLLGSFITEPAAMTICALLLGPPVLRPSSQHAAEVRHARPAVRQRVDRRHADPLRGAAGADGGAALGLGPAST